MKITQNSTSPPPTLHFKVHLQEIPLIKGITIISRACPNFPKQFSLDSIEFSMTILLNVQ
jgi:hypothetical protein